MVQRGQELGFALEAGYAFWVSERLMPTAAMKFFPLLRIEFGTLDENN